MEAKESNIKVYTTTDYDSFKKMLGNRDTKNEGKIIESIQKVGQVYSPVIVNEKYEVIDGQNRLEAFRQLGLPVYYILQEGLGIDACRSVNVGQTNWGTEDYISSYAKEGSPSYCRLESLLNTYRKPFSIQGVVAMANPTTISSWGPNALRLIKKGEYLLSKGEYELAITRLSSAQELGYTDLCKRRKFNARVFYSCVSYIYQNPNVQAADVIEKLNAYESNLPGTNRVDEQLQYIDGILNIDMRAKNRVFLATDFQRREFLEEADK